MTDLGITSETDGKGDTVGFSYDGLNRITGIDFPRAGSADVSIAWGAKDKTLTRGTFQQTVNFDGFARMASVVTTDSASPAQNATITMRNDVLGRRTFQSYPASAAGDDFEYDMLDRIKTITHADSTTRTHTYGATSHAVKNERNITTTFGYRAYGNPDQREVMQITVPTPNASIGIGRNGIGNVTSIAQGGLTRTYGYNASNFVTSITDPETGTTIFGRDGVGNMTSHQVGATPVTSYTYDDLDRVKTITYPSPTPQVIKRYWGDNSLKDISGGVATRYFEYDANKNLTLERLTADGTVFDIRHAYGANDGRDTTTFPSGTTVSYSSNGFGRPRSASPFLTSVDFHPGGALKTLAFANGVTTGITLNARQWPQQLTSTKSGTLVNLKYTYDGTGNVAKLEDLVDGANTIAKLTYDDIDRLLTASTGTETRQLTDDGVGNIRTQTLGGATMTYTYDGRNRLTGITGGSRAYSFNYDGYGNMSFNGSQVFGYNGASQMICARCGQADQALYDHDGLGMRVKSKKSGETTYFMYGLDGHLLMEKTPNKGGGGVETKEYIYVAGKQVAVKTILQAATTVAPTSGSSASALAGQAATVSVTISGNSPTGTVTFREGGTVLGTATLSNGVATLAIPGLSLGTHSITASYSGDANNAASSTTIEVRIYDLKWLPAILNLLLED